MSQSDERATARPPTPAASTTVLCPVCGSDTTRLTIHPAKPHVVIVDCDACGHTSIAPAP